jgi:orotidine-5'-phosphate decarboxylase
VNARDRHIVALDVPTPEAGHRLVDQLAGDVGMFKVCHELYTAAGPAFVRQLVGDGHRVFLDVKFHDIPNTVAGAVGSAAALGVSFVDVHALGGPAVLEAAVGALPGVGARLLAITVLTSHDRDTLSRIGIGGEVLESVLRLARMASQARADGVVASPEEIRPIREACGDDLLIVTPGIRPAGSARGDQTRIATPRAAREAGADYVVVGRPITQSEDPVAAARRIVDELA